MILATARCINTAFSQLLKLGLQLSGRRNNRLFPAYLLVAVVVVMTVFPIFLVITTAFKSEDEWFALPIHWLPKRPTLANFETAFTSEYGMRAISNSLIVAFGGTALALFTGFPAAYAISRHRTGKFGLFVMPLIMRASPPAAVAIPLLVFYASLGLVDTTQGLVLVYGATTVFYVIWMVKPFVDAVPLEVEDAAMIDGMPRWKIPFKLILPMVAGGVVAATIFVFMLNWTEFVLALNLTRFDARTVPLQMSTLSALGDISEGQGQAAALSTVSLVPFLFIAYLLQKQLIRTFFVGAVRS